MTALIHCVLDHLHLSVDATKFVKFCQCLAQHGNTSVSEHLWNSFRMSNTKGEDQLKLSWGCISLLLPRLPKLHVPLNSFSWATSAVWGALKKFILQYLLPGSVWSLLCSWKILIETAVSSDKGSQSLWCGGPVGYFYPSNLNNVTVLLRTFFCCSWKR